MGKVPEINGEKQCSREIAQNASNQVIQQKGAREKVWDSKENVIHVRLWVILDVEKRFFIAQFTMMNGMPQFQLRKRNPCLL